MKINEKIKVFFNKTGQSNIEIGELYGSTSATIGNYLNGKREIPVDFIVWLKKYCPEIDLNILFSDDEVTEICIAKINDSPEKKKEILKEIESVLKKYI